MTRFRFLTVLLLGTASPALAQQPWTPQPQPGYVNPFAPPTDAEQLSQQLRLLAANPTDLTLLLNTARLSLKVGDSDGAAALYTRADRVSPGNPQVKAGIARLLVQAGRPGEALRRFQEAQASGATERDFGPDRALAFDLVGEQERAQREYRALLRLGPDDETIRRYALSLGVSGLKEPALALLEPLNRRSDRGAWRARAFVLAMTGDRAGAEQIATTMMPAGMAQGLAPFFDRLPRLSAVERAFAVHFGETRPSPTRLSDARLVPPLPALAPEPNPFPAIAARQPVQVAAAQDDKRKRRNRRDRNRPAEPVRLASVAVQSALPPPPAPTAAQLASLNAVRPMAASGRAGVTVLPPPADAYRAPVTRAASPFVASPGASTAEPDFALAAVADLSSGGAAAPTIAPPVAIAARPAAVAPASTTTIFSGVPGAQVSTFSLAAPPAPPPAAIAQAPVPAPVTQTPTLPPVAVAAVTPATGTPPAPRGEDGDAVLAAIVAGITVPASELTAATIAPVAAPPAPPRSRLLASVEKPEPVERTRADSTAKVAAERTEPKAKTTAERADPKAKTTSAAADAKAKDAKSQTRADAAKPDPKKSEPKKPEPKKPDPAKTEPQRYWVQVAGGADEGALAKEWNRVSAATPSLKGKAGWTTPLRATNRVLTGPFKTSAEAMTMVNTLKKEGLSAFMFISDAGQKVTRLGGK